MMAKKVHDRNTDESILQDGNLLNLLFNSMDEMFHILEVIYEGGEVVDFRYLAVNQATLKMVEKSRGEMIGNRAKELFGIVEDYWIRAMERVDNTGEPLHMENYTAALDRYFDVHFFKVAPERKLSSLIISPI